MSLHFLEPKTTNRADETIIRRLPDTAVVMFMHERKDGDCALARKTLLAAAFAWLEDNDSELPLSFSFDSVEDSEFAYLTVEHLDPGVAV